MRKTLITLVLTVVALLGTGIIVLASASCIQGKTPYFFFLKQVKSLGLAILVGYVCSRFDYHTLWKKWLVWKQYPWGSIVLFVGIAGLMVLTLCPGIAYLHKGSYRWLYWGGKQVFQPGEFAKPAIVVAVAVWLDHVDWRVKQFWRGGAAIPSLLVGVFALLLLLEKDLGAMMVVCVLGVALMFIAGTRKRHLLAVGGCGVLGIAGLLATGAMSQMKENRWGRILAWLEGNDTASSAGYHLKQSILAFQSGGLWGVNLNESIQKHAYLPEAYTDFIFAIGGEELGFFFSVGVVIAYAIVLVCGTLIAIHAPDRLGRLLAFGMTLLLVFQAAFNIGVVTGALPTKGLALPFFSFGGSNLVTALVAVGTLFNVGVHIGVQDERMHTQVVRNAISTV
ncbi:MAG: putative lipid II flippase FtsW [Kiritimatiellaeota bacterium]|nr:putative lipid II flippase FtsW [Kiritimatiellota bacterium]